MEYSKGAWKTKYYLFIFWYFFLNLYWLIDIILDGRQLETAGFDFRVDEDDYHEWYDIK
jgi:hypothetical protein